MVEIKGSAVRDAVAAYQAELPDEYQKVLAALDPQTRTLLAEVRSNEWMPLDAFVRYLQAQVDVTGVDPYKLHTERAEFVVERQLHGLYRFFAKLASPQSLITRLSTVNTIFWRGIEVERTVVSKTKVIVRYRGFEKQHRLMEPIIIGFFRKVLQVNGAQDVEAEFTTPIGSRPDHAELLITWR